MTPDRVLELLTFALTAPTAALVLWHVVGDLVTARRLANARREHARSERLP